MPSRRNSEASIRGDLGELAGLPRRPAAAAAAAKSVTEPERRVSLPALPSELLSSIATYVGERDVLKLGETGRPIYLETSHERNSVHLAMRAEHAPSIQALDFLLGADVPAADRPRPHPSGGPNTIPELPKELRERPYAAAAQMLANQAKDLHSFSAADQMQAYRAIFNTMNMIPYRHTLPIIEVLAPKVAKLPAPVNAEAHDDLLAAIVEQPLDRQPKALKGLTRGMTHVAEPLRLERFVGALAPHSSQIRADLLLRLLPVIRELPATSKPRTLRLVLDAMATLSTHGSEGQWSMTNLCHGMCNYIMGSIALLDPSPDPSLRQDSLLRSLARQIARVPDYPLESTIRHLDGPERATVREAVRGAARDASGTSL